MAWDEVRFALEDCKAITWDTCHKIYVLMDDEQVAYMKGLTYDPIIMNEGNEEELLRTLEGWYAASCWLRFITSVRTNHADPNAGFTNLISQFEFDDDEEDEDDYL